MNDTTTTEPTAATDATILTQLVDHASPMSVCFETLIEYAANRRATDFFCAANRDGFRVFMRCDGVLYELGQVERDWGVHFINYVNILCRNPVSDHKHPVDGRILIHDGDSPIDMRVSIMPTFFGEELAIRILDGRFRLVNLESLGMLPDQCECVEELIHRRSGLILVSGRTGSGKTTTLYSILKKLNDGTRKINTLEDPVECEIPGVFQSQVDSAHGQDFPDLLRALLRHAPDVIMVGEIRDPETAEVAVQAATSGHLVFATVHAPTAAQTIFSLLQLGVNPHVLAGAINAVIAQDMLHTPCPACAEAVDVPAGFSLEAAKAVMGESFEPHPRQRKGCEQCNQRGYRGLTGIFEVLEVTPELRELIRNGESPSAVSKLAMENGMLSLSTSAEVAFACGRTTVEEMYSILTTQSGQF